MMLKIAVNALLVLALGASGEIESLNTVMILHCIFHFSIVSEGVESGPAVADPSSYPYVVSMDVIVHHVHT